MRQLTTAGMKHERSKISKLPMRQLTITFPWMSAFYISKLPMRQLTALMCGMNGAEISKLPMRQLTMLERKKKPTARALIHLFPTLTQIYSCLEIY